MSESVERFMDPGVLPEGFAPTGETAGGSGPDPKLLRSLGYPLVEVRRYGESIIVMASSERYEVRGSSLAGNYAQAFIEAAHDADQRDILVRQVQRELLHQ